MGACRASSAACRAASSAASTRAVRRGARLAQESERASPCMHALGAYRGIIGQARSSEAAEQAQVRNRSLAATRETAGSRDPESAAARAAGCGRRGLALGLRAWLRPGCSCRLPWLQGGAQAEPGSWVRGAATRAGGCGSRRRSRGGRAAGRCGSVVELGDDGLDRLCVSRERGRRKSGSSAAERVSPGRGGLDALPSSPSLGLRCKLARLPTVRQPKPTTPTCAAPHSPERALDDDERGRRDLRPRSKLLAPAHGTSSTARRRARTRSSGQGGVDWTDQEQPVGRRAGDEPLSRDHVELTLSPCLPLAPLPSPARFSCAVKVRLPLAHSPGEVLPVC